MTIESSFTIVICLEYSRQVLPSLVDSWPYLKTVKSCVSVIGVTQGQSI